MRRKAKGYETEVERESCEVWLMEGAVGAIYYGSMPFIGPTPERNGGMKVSRLKNKKNSNF